MLGFAGYVLIGIVLLGPIPKCNAGMVVFCSDMHCSVLNAMVRQARIVSDYDGLGAAMRRTELL